MTFDWLQGDLRGLEVELLGGVSENNIRLASESIGLEFPPSYREFLRAFGCGSLSYQEIIGLGGPPHLDVSEMTKYLRETSRLSRFPSTLIPVLADGYGNYECLNTAAKDERGENPVVEWLHDGGDDQTPRVLAPTFEEWLRGLILQIRMVESGDES